MSQFTKLSNAVAAAAQSAQPHLSVDVAAAVGDPVATHAAVTDLDKTCTQLAVEMDKFVHKAKEPDPDRRLYGPQMTERIFALAAQLQQLRDAVQQRLAALGDAVQPLLQQQQAQREAERRLAEDERRQREALENEQRVREAAAAALKAEEDRQRRIRDEQEREQQRVQAERLAKVLEEKERAAAAARVAAREQERVATERAEQERAQRRRDAVDLGLAWSVTLLQNNCPTHRELRQALTTLDAVAKNIIEDPSNPLFRKIRRANPNIQADLLRFAGGEECLLSLGFVEKTVPIPGVVAGAERVDDLREDTSKHFEQVYILDEPDMRDDPEVWLAWFDGIKANRDLLETTLAALQNRR